MTPPWDASALTAAAVRLLDDGTTAQQAQRLLDLIPGGWPNLLLDVRVNAIYQAGREVFTGPRPPVAGHQSRRAHTWASGLLEDIDDDGAPHTCRGNSRRSLEELLVTGHPDLESPPYGPLEQAEALIYLLRLSCGPALGHRRADTHPARTAMAGIS